MQPTKLFSEFFKSEKAGGILLIFATLSSLILANSEFQIEYISWWSFEFGGHSLVHWINEGLMAIFFLLIGLELEREIYEGELSNFKKASLPIFGAVGGMLLPAAIYLLFNKGTEHTSGFGIPMATDIAFAIGILALVGKRIPVSLKVFITAFAVVDDLGAILVIAVFYSSSISMAYLIASLSIFILLIILNRLRVTLLFPYLIGGVLMWYFMAHSGIHAVITGILLAFAIPFTDGKERSPSYQLQNFLHKPVAFIILPIFALANTCIPLGENWLGALDQRYSMGIIFGLFFGKPLGIILISYLSVKLKLARLPADLKWKSILSAGFIGGIGFTVSIFITFLAFPDPVVINNAKISIIIASIFSGLAGYIILKIIYRESKH